MSKKIMSAASEVLNPAYGYAIEKIVFLNTSKTACLSMGKTLIDGRPMLYIYAQLWDGAKWYTDRMLLCRDSGEILNNLKSWLSVHADRRAR